jgi:hypothetical protein
VDQSESNSAFQTRVPHLVFDSQEVRRADAFREIAAAAAADAAARLGKERLELDVLQKQIASASLCGFIGGVLFGSGKRKEIVIVFPFV